MALTRPRREEVKEVLHMININATIGNGFAMPSDICFGMRDRDAWMGALLAGLRGTVAPVGVVLEGTGVSKHRFATADATRPGISAWSPPV